MRGLSLSYIGPSFNKEPVSVWAHDRTLTSGCISKDFIFLTYGITKSEFSFQEYTPSISGISILFSRSLYPSFLINSVSSFAENLLKQTLKTTSFFSPYICYSVWSIQNIFESARMRPIRRRGVWKRFSLCFVIYFLGWAPLQSQKTRKKVSNISR